MSKDKIVPVQAVPPMPTIDDESKRIAMAKAMVDNQRRRREQECGAEIDAAVNSILAKHHCQAKFMELREGGQTTRIWIQPVAVDDKQGG